MARYQAAIIWPPQLIDGLLETLERFGPARQGGLAPFLADWERFDLLRGQRVQVQLGERLMEGDYLGIDPDGALRLDTADGPLRLHSGEVSLRLPPSDQRGSLTRRGHEPVDRYRQHQPALGAARCRWTRSDAGSAPWSCRAARSARRLGGPGAPERVLVGNVGGAVWVMPWPGWSVRSGDWRRNSPSRARITWGCGLPIRSPRDWAWTAGWHCSPPARRGAEATLILDVGTAATFDLLPRREPPGWPDPAWPHHDA